MLASDQILINKRSLLIEIYQLFILPMTNETILFINRYQNRAWVRTDKGSFITSEGNVYDFDFGSGDVSDLISALENDMKNKTPSKVCDKSSILEAFNLIGQINKDSEMILATFACDAGQKTLLSYYNGAIVPLATSGCICGSVDCKEVAQILDILEKNDFYKWESFGDKCSIEEIKSRGGSLENIKIFDANSFKKGQTSRFQYEFLQF